MEGLFKEGQTKIDNTKIDELISKIDEYVGNS